MGPHRDQPGDPQPGSVALLQRARDGRAVNQGRKAGGKDHAAELPPLDVCSLLADHANRAQDEQTRNPWKDRGIHRVEGVGNRLWKVGDGLAGGFGVVRNSRADPVANNEY